MFRISFFFFLAVLITSSPTIGWAEDVGYFTGESCAPLSSEDSWRWRTRLLPYASWEKHQQKNDFSGFNGNTFGLMSGVERRGKRKIYLGFDAGADWISTEEKDNHSTKDIDAFKTLFSCGVERDQWGCDIGLGYGYQSQEMIQGSYATKWAGDSSANQFGLCSEFRIKVSSGLFQMEPFVGFDYMNLEEKAFQMQSDFGPQAPFTIVKNSHNGQTGMLGLRYRWRQTAQFVTWYPELSGMWCREFGDTSLFRSSWIDPFPTVYTVSNYKNDENRLVFGASLVGKVGKCMDFFCQYSASMAGDESIHSILAGMNWYF